MRGRDARADLGLDDVEDLADDTTGAAHPLDLGARLAGDHRQTAPASRSDSIRASVTVVDRLAGRRPWPGRPCRGSARRPRGAAGPAAPSGPGPSPRRRPRAARGPSHRCRRRASWRRVRDEVVDVAVGGADAAVGHALDEVLERDVDVGGAVDAASGFGQRGVERLGLDPRPRVAVEDRAVDGVRRLEPIEEDAHDGVVRHELAATHVAVGLASERRAVGDGLPQQVARGEDRDAEPSRQRRRLGALARPRGPQQDDDRHRPTERRTWRAEPGGAADGRERTRGALRDRPAATTRGSAARRVASPDEAFVVAHHQLGFDLLHGLDHDGHHDQEARAAQARARPGRAPRARRSTARRRRWPGRGRPANVIRVTTRRR